MFRFIINPTGKFRSGRLVYYKSEHFFDFLPTKNADVSLLVRYIHIDIDSITMAVQQVWGLYPCEKWIEERLNVPEFIEGELMVEGNIEPGRTYRLDKGKEVWIIKFDSQTGWVCFGENEIMKSDTAIKFAENTIAVINNNQLRSLWLKPEFIANQ